MGRAKNAMLEFLENRLIVPKIYLDADWGGQNVDVLAIERDGVGDVHAVLLFGCDTAGDPEEFGSYWIAAMNPLIDRFQEVNAQYKYIATVLIGGGENEVLPLQGIPHEISDRSFSPDGLGRIGFLSVHSLVKNGEPQVRVVFKPERFRAKIAKLADEFVQQHEADWEIRA